MCSEECPCWAGENDKYKEVWAEYFNESETFYEEHGRTWNESKDGKQPLVWVEDYNVAINTFEQCYNKVMKDKADGKWSEVKEYIKQKSFAFMKETENNLECASICKPGLFYISVSVTQGRPEKDCVTALIDHLHNRSFEVGIIAMT